VLVRQMLCLSALSLFFGGFTLGCSFGPQHFELFFGQSGFRQASVSIRCCSLIERSNSPQATNGFSLLWLEFKSHQMDVEITLFSATGWLARYN